MLNVKAKQFKNLGPIDTATLSIIGIIQNAKLSKQDAFNVLSSATNLYCADNMSASNDEFISNMASYYDLLSKTANSYSHSLLKLKAAKLKKLLEV